MSKEEKSTLVTGAGFQADLIARIVAAVEEKGGDGKLVEYLTSKHGQGLLAEVAECVADGVHGSSKRSEKIVGMVDGARISSALFTSLLSETVKISKDAPQQIHGLVKDGGEHRLDKIANIIMGANTHVVPVNYDLPLAAMVAACGFKHVDPLITEENFPCDKKGEERAILTLEEFLISHNLESLFTDFIQRGVKQASLRQLLAILSVFRPEKRYLRIHALGDTILAPKGKCAPCVLKNQGVYRLVMVKISEQRRYDAEKCAFLGEVKI